MNSALFYVSQCLSDLYLIHAEESCFPRDTARNLAATLRGTIWFTLNGVFMGSVEG
ncbi:hypothetical protein AHIS1_p041 [Acaryochloris phage A-HIS1]|nr:hypothetical protein AHIS1_p041 [Acaryochloris phage A-HIS1]